MIIIIFAILLFVIGVVMIVSSVEVRKSNAVNNHKYRPSDYSVKKDDIIISPVEEDKDLNINYDYEDAEELEFMNDDDLYYGGIESDLDIDFDDTTEDQYNYDDYNIDNVNQNESVNNGIHEENICIDTIMFLDNEMIFGEDNTDLYLNKNINKLKRIGKGELQLLNNAFYFKSDKKQYRLDFSHIEKVFGEKNYFVIKNVEKKYQIFFMSDNDDNFYKKVRAQFNKLNN